MTEILMMTDDSNTSSAKNSDKKDGITCFLNPKNRFRLSKFSRLTRTSRNHNENGRNRKSKTTALPNADKKKMKKDEKLPNKNIHNKNSSGKPFPKCL